jgi:hypothetical protein
MIANIRVRQSIETIYPEEAFALEAGQNSRAKTTV